MKFEELENQFSAKKRTLNDLSRFISNKSDDHANYCLLLGAGASVSSGVRAASTLIKEWRREISIEMGADKDLNQDQQIDFLKKNQGSWFDVNKEYSSLFERRFDLQRQRRVFVEREVSGKSPSIGYVYLTSLVEQGYFNTIFTTNFDDLVNEAFYLYSNQRPIVCAHDSSINSVTITSKRPKVIKLHGDYLFDDLKSTLRETESLEQNMKAKLTEFSKDHGLVVIGYSGADRSIMETLNALLRNEDYMKSGIYWCVRKGDEISEEFRKLLFKDRVYYIEIDGFDEFFADIFSTFNEGKIIPESALGVNRRNDASLTSLINSISQYSPNNSILNKAKHRLERHTTRSALASLIAREKDEDRPNISSNSMNDNEMLMISEISELISSENQKEAFIRIERELYTSKNPRVIRELLEQKIYAYLANKDYHNAKKTSDEIIKLEPERASSYINKTRLCINQNEKIECLEKAIEVDPYHFQSYLNLCDIYISKAKNSYGENKSLFLSKAIELANKSSDLYPAQNNGIWYRYFDIYDLSPTDKKDITNKKNNIIEKIKNQNPYSKIFLELNYRSICDLAETEKNEKLLHLLNDLETSEKRYSDENKFFSKLKLKILNSLKDESKLRDEIKLLENEINSDPDLAVRVAKIYRSLFGEDQKALDLLKQSLRTSQFDWEVLEETVECLCDIGKTKEAREIFEKWSSRLNHEKNYSLNIYILENEKRFDECFKLCLEYSNITGKINIEKQAYYLLLAEEFQETENLMKDYLEKIKFNPEASVEIVNYEFSRKMQQKRPDQGRLQKVLNFSFDNLTKVGVYAVLEEKQLLITSLKESLENDKTSKYNFMRWPVMQKHLNDLDIKKILN